MCLVQKMVTEKHQKFRTPAPPPLIKDFFINFTNFFSPSPRPEPCSGQLRRHFFLQTTQMASCNGLLYHLMWCIGHRYVLMNVSQTTSHYHQKWTLYIWRGFQNGDIIMWIFTCMTKWQYRKKWLKWWQGGYYQLLQCPSLIPTASFPSSSFSSSFPESTDNCWQKRSSFRHP